MARASRIPKFGLAIDWETSGYQVPKERHGSYADKHQGLSFAALVFDMRSFEEVDHMYLEIKYDPKYTWDDGAAKVHGLSQEHLARHGLSQADAAVELGGMILKYFGDTPIVLLGHRVRFDRDFTNQLMDSIDIELKYDPIMLDSCAFSTALLEVSYSDELFAAVGLPPRAEHNALEDIRYTLASMRQIKDYMMLGLETAAKEA